MKRLVLNSNDRRAVPHAAPTKTYHMNLDVPIEYLHLQGEIERLFDRLTGQDMGSDTLDCTFFEHKCDIPQVWDVLFDSLHLNPHITKISCDDDTPGVDSLAKAIKSLRRSPYIHSLTYYSHKQNTEKMMDLCSILAHNLSVKHLDVSITRVNRNILTAFEDYIAHQCRLETLRVPRGLGKMMMTNIMTTLNLNTTITALDLSRSSIGDDGAKNLSEYISVNKSLINLSLSSNQIGDVGARFILDSLRVNQTLLFLDIRNNVFTKSTSQAFAKAFNSTCSLDVLYIHHKIPREPSLNKCQEKILKKAEKRAEKKKKEKMHQEKRRIFKIHVNVYITLQILMLSKQANLIKSLQSDIVSDILSMVLVEEYEVDKEIIKNLVAYSRDRKNLFKKQRDFMAILRPPRV